MLTYTDYYIITYVHWPPLDQVQHHTVADIVTDVSLILHTCLIIDHVYTC